MKNLTPSQLKSLSEFLNTIAAAWFTAGVISPFFIKQEAVIRSIILAIAGISVSIIFLILALFIVRKVKL